MTAETAQISQGGNLMTADEAAAYLRVCPKTLRAIRQRGLIRYVAVTPRKIFYRPEDCDAYLASCLRSETHQPTERRRSGKTLKAGANVVSFSARRRERQAAGGR